MSDEIDPHDLAIEAAKATYLAEAAAAKQAMETAEQAMTDAMREAWVATATYAEIGRAVGMSKQAAHHRIHKGWGDGTYETASAEDVPIGASLARQRRGSRAAVVADKRIGQRNVTFYDAHDAVITDVPLGTPMGYVPPIGDERGGDGQ